MRTWRWALCAVAMTATGGVMALDDDGLSQVLNHRLAGDRTGACLAAAVVENGKVARAVACADPGKLARISVEHSFEIGSVSKTMNAALLAMLVAEGKLGLDDPLARHVPKETKVPSFKDQPITLRHLLTHTSGLPSIPPSWQMTDMANPYSTLQQADLFDALAKLDLTTAPGSRHEYSNFGAMLLSWVIAKTAGQDYESLIQQRLFRPLGMQHAYIEQAPAVAKPVQGHTPNRLPTSAWTFPANTAGVGGVRASLNDMIHYVQAHMGQGDSPIQAALARTHETLDKQAGNGMAWGWMVAQLNGREFLAHEGGTGGFSSFVAFGRDGKRGVIVLADTALHSLGGLGSVGLHLLDPSIPLGKPRKETKADVAVLDALVGRYRLDNGMNMELRRKGEALEIQAEGQPAFLMGHDSAGDFYPLDFDAVLRPSKRSDGSVGFSWHQGGGAVAAKRMDQTAEPTAVKLSDYVGRYPLMKGFDLKVFVENEQLMAQATGQGAFPLDPSGQDRFVADLYGIEIVFERGAGGNISALKLHQAGQTLGGSRQ